MDIKAASRVGSGRAHPGPLAPDCILLGSVVCCSDRPDLSLGENLCVFRSAKFCSDPGRSAKFTANIQDLNISDPVIIGCKGYDLGLPRAGPCLTFQDRLRLKRGCSQSISDTSDMANPR